MEGGPASRASERQLAQLQRLAGNRAVTSLLQRPAGASLPVQRTLEVAGEQVDAAAVRANAQPLGATRGGISQLLALAKTKKEITRHASWADAVRAVDALDLPPGQRRAKQAYAHMLQQANAIPQAANHESLEGDFIRTVKPLLEELKALGADQQTKESAVEQAVEKVRVALRPFHRKLFAMNADRTNQAADTALTGNPSFGYHLTKLGNIPGIRAKGLDPAMGASDRGSVAMSTSDQVKGSVQTSEGRVVFGTKPSTFRPYVNQYEDRRQMIEGTPTALKPIMLRFHVDSVVGWENVTQDDYMDTDARSARVLIPPAAIEALTGVGDWVPIADLDLAAAPLQMRDKADDARMDVKWDGSGVPVILFLEEIRKAFDSPLFDNIESEFSTKGADVAVRALEAKRDTVVGVKAGSTLTLTYTFRGATMQTSGNPKTWEYAFSVNTGKKDQGLPEWLVPAMLLYKKKYGDVAATQVREFEQAKAY